MRVDRDHRRCHIQRQELGIDSPGMQRDHSAKDDRYGNGSAVLSQDGTILIGGRESYEVRCRHCHVVPRADAAQTKLPLSS